MAEEPNGRISVSRDALRADLAELKNDLKEYISSQLEKKADAEDVKPLHTAISSLTDWRIRTERGEFTEAQKNTVSAWIRTAFVSRSERAWTGVERKIAIAGVFIGLMGAVAGIAAAAEVFIR